MRHQNLHRKQLLSQWKINADVLMKILPYVFSIGIKVKQIFAKKMPAALALRANPTLGL
jgi:hypothetical protein